MQTIDNDTGSADPFVHVCNKHGTLRRSQVNSNGIGKRGLPMFKCKACHKQNAIKFYAKHKDKVLEDCAEYRKKNPEKLRKIKYESFQRHGHKWKRKEHDKKYVMAHYESRCEMHRLYAKKISAFMLPVYVKKKMAQQYGWKTEDIPEELIILGRVILALKREIRQQKKELKGGK